MKIKKISQIFFLLAVFFAAPYFAKAATYYVSPNGLDSNDGLSQGAPKEYITTALGMMSSGDTLILEDGTYTGLNNMIGDNSIPKTYPPSGTSGNYTTIEAQNVGQAIIDGQYAAAPFSTANRGSNTDYLRIDGIHFRRGNCGVFSLLGNYDKVLNSGFEDGEASTNEASCGIADIVGGSTYDLVEDSWVWGKGGYGLYTDSSNGGTNHIIFRRDVVRQDDTPLTGPASGIGFYNAHDNVAQNDIVLDSNLNANTTYITGAFSTGWNGVTTDAERNHGYYGDIALNSMFYSGFAPYKLGSITTISNSIFWGNGNQGIFADPADSGNLNISHDVVGSNGGSGYKSGTAYGVIFNVDNSISDDNANYGYSYINNVSNVDTFGNALGICSNCTVTNGISTDPQVAASGFTNAGLKYLPRTETGSNLSGAASDGGDIGANIVYQIGDNESLYGDSGWNTLTTNHLWPFSNERMWANKMQSYSAAGPGGNRGFASSGSVTLSGLLVNVGASQTPLTDYIWDYLGNSRPNISNIYGDFIPPAGPTSLGVM